MAVEWASKFGCDTAIVGRCHVIVWTGSTATDIDDGHEVCSSYVPTSDRAYAPDGLMIVGRRTLPTKDRTEARRMALEIHAQYMRTTDLRNL